MLQSLNCIRWVTGSQRRSFLMKSFDTWLKRERPDMTLASVLINHYNRWIITAGRPAYSETKRVFGKPFMNLVDTALMTSNLSNRFYRLEMEIKLGVVSIALTWTWATGDMCDVYKRKSRGSSTEPCGTPCATETYVLVSPMKHCLSPLM